MLRAFPGDWESFNNLGNVLLGLDRFDEAVAAFQQAIRLQPDRVEIVFNLSEALARAERHEERQAVMRMRPRSAATMPKVQTELGLAEAAMRDFDGGRAGLSRGDPARSAATPPPIWSSASCSRI